MNLYHPTPSLLWCGVSRIASLNLKKPETRAIFMPETRDTPHHMNYVYPAPFIY